MFQNQYLQTKLTPPELTPQIIPRGRLKFFSLCQQKKRITLISAPAGYGKSIFATQLLREQSSPSAWLSLESRDNEVDRFLRYLVAAVKKAVPDFGEEILRLVNVARLPSAAYMAETLVALFDHLQKPLVLVFDDFHNLTDQSVQTMVVTLIQYLPENLHLIFICRIDPSWPISRWRSYEWLNEIRAVDLRFTLEETELLFKEHGLPPETVSKLHKKAEGWVTGLQLIKQSLHSAANPEILTRASSDTYPLIQDYLVEEVIAHQPDFLLDFLAVTALLDSFCAPLCDVLFADRAGVQKSAECIKQIKENNLFLVPLDRQQLWYRYHHLFQELLRKHLETHLTREDKVQLRRRTGEWFAEKGLVEEALKYFLAAGEVDAAVWLTRKEMHAVLDKQSDIRTFNRWVSMFPKSYVDNNPSLLVIKAIYYVFIYNLPGALELVARAERLLGNPESPLPESFTQEIIGEIECIYAFCLYWQGNPRQALRHAEKAITLVPRNHYTTYGACVMYTAFSLALIGRREEALKLLEHNLAKDYADGCMMAGQLLTCKTTVHIYAGEMDRAKNCARHMLEIHNTHPMTDYRIGSAHYFLGSVAYECNDLDEAETCFEQAKKLRYLMDPRIYHDCLLGLAQIAKLKNKAVESGRLLSEALDFAIEMKDPYRITCARAFEMRQKGVSDEDLSPPHPDMFYMDFNMVAIEPLSVIYAEYRVSTGTSGDVAIALEIIEGSLNRAKEYCNTRLVIQLLALKALALKSAGHSEDALKALEESLNMARPRRFARTFLDRGPIMAALLSQLLQKDYRDNYIRELLKAFEQYNPPGENSESASGRLNPHHHHQPADGAVREMLSNRELDVLELLGERLTNKEIAGRLHISANTVKLHTITIYRKLNVNNRRQAASVAQRIGLLPSS